MRMAYQTFVNQAAVQIQLADQQSDPANMRVRVDVLVAPLRAGALEGRLSARDVKQYLDDIRRVVTTTTPPVGTHQINLRRVTGEVPGALAYFVEQMETVLKTLAER
jgi:hypothetical protein